MSGSVTPPTSAAQRLQLLFAYPALLLLPLPAFRPLETSITWGDCFLLPAVLLNLHRLKTLHSWQIPMILSMVFMLWSQAVDPDGTLVEIGQVLWIYGVVLPFGWLAFLDIRPRQMIPILLVSMGLSSMVAALQSAGILDEVGKQAMWEVQGARRAAGLSMSCSSLCLGLTPLIPLLLHVENSRMRAGLLVALLTGLVATLAKSVIFVVPGLLFYAIREPNRKAMLMSLGAIAVLGTAFFIGSGKMQETLENVSASVDYRIDKLGGSIQERSSTMNYAVSFLDECLVVGLGYNGTHRQLTQHLGNTVHVFHIGLILIGGFPTAIFHNIGVWLLVRNLIRYRQWPSVLLMAGQYLGVCTMTVMMVSYQYVPYVIAGAILGWQAEQAQIATVKRSQKKPAPHLQPALPARQPLPDAA